MITPKNRFKSPFTVLEKVTAVMLADIHAVARIRPEILTKGAGFSATTVHKLFGEYELPSKEIEVRQSWLEDDPLGDDDYGFGRRRAYQW